MSEMRRIRKRDKPITQVRKLIQQEIQQSGAGIPRNIVSGSVFGGTGDLSGQTGDTNAQTKVFCYNVLVSSPAYATRGQILPGGSVYALDDVTNDQILLHNSLIMDPVFMWSF